MDRSTISTVEVSAVVCLVRGRDDSAVEQRLDDVCRTWFPQDAMADAVWMRKIQYVRGDVSEERFGLDPHIFQAMKTEVDVVFHVAAEVNMLKPYEALVSANVTATAHVLNFCAEALTNVKAHWVTFWVMLSCLHMIRSDLFHSHSGLAFCLSLCVCVCVCLFVCVSV